MDSRGFCVVEIFSQNEILEISNQFLDICLNSPEMKKNMVHDRFVMGGVGYCPFASVWYHPLIRSVTKKIYDKVLEKKIFPELKKDDKYFSMLPDRPLVRFPSQKVDEKGKWHQDDSANAITGDDIYGGWLNLNHNETQYFKCIPGTHRIDHTIFNNLSQKNGERRGYSDFKSKNDQKFLSNYWNSEIKELVTIPPGHILIFQENMIHTVFPNPNTQNCILRLHPSFMISDHKTILHDRKNKIKLLDLFKNQENVPVRSGQKTPVYSPFNLYPKNISSLKSLSNHYIDCCKNENGIVKRFLPSLKEISQKSGVSMHPEMTSDEIQYYIPHLVKI